MSLDMIELDRVYKKLFNKDKEEKEVKMETKSRYEVVSDLENQKRQLIRERDSFNDQIESKEQKLIELKRELEDEERALKKFKDSIEERKETIKELIGSLDLSLERLSKINTQSKK